MTRRYCIIFATAVIFFVLLFPSVTLVQQQNKLKPAQSVNDLTTNHLFAKNDVSFLRDAFFPREPRLEDVQPISGFAPTGIASYGSNGSIIHTTSVRGITTLSEIGLGFFSGEVVNNSQVIPYVGIKNGSLQENSVLWLGNLGTYWTQNVVSLTEDTPSSYSLELIDNIWNFTSISSNINPIAINGTGNVQCETLNNATSCAYIAVDPQFFTVTAPVTITLTMSIANAANGAATILFQYQIQDSSGHNFSGQYDEAALFPSSLKTGSYFQIGGESPVSEYLGGGTTLTLPSDLELVFGGPGGGSSVFVNSVSGSQQLEYFDGSTYVSVPDSFSVGSDTGEEVSGMSVASDFGNPALPSAVLAGGAVSSYQLWPLPVTFLIRGNNKLGNNTLDIRGQILYSQGLAPNARVLPGTNLTVRDSLTGESISTNANGAFDFPFKATQKGIYHDSIAFLGSLVFEKSNENLQIAVSSINITGVSGEEIIASVNGTQFVIQDENNILVPVIHGTYLVVTFQNVSYSGNQQEHFKGFSTGQNDLILNGSSPVGVAASFSSGTNTNSLVAAYFIYVIVGSVGLVIGIVVGHLFRGRGSKWNGSTSGP